MNQTRALIALALLCGWLGVVGAQPTATWSPTYGGDGFEELSDLVLAPGGGVLAVGKSTSPLSGTLTRDPQGSEDLLAVRVGADGTVLWEQRVGGEQRDGGTKVITDNLGRYVIAGYTYSSASGNKASVRESAGEWAADVWLVCLDRAGRVVWERTFGGLGGEEAVGISLTPDGNYLVAARTNSPADPGTSRQAPLKGSQAYWLIEVDPTGSLVREWVYGGDGDDLAWGMRRLRDDTYLLYGASQSGASFDKTTASFGLSDMWLVQVDRGGNVVKDFQFGGESLENPFVLSQFADGDILVGGQSLSGVSGNKSVPSMGSEVDFWAIRFELSTGRIRWDRAYGGEGFDDIYTVGRNSNDFHFLAGITRSPTRTLGSGPIRGRDDAWALYIAPDGEPIWDITRGGDENESIRSIIRSETGGWYLGGISNSDPFDWKSGPALGTLFNGVRSNDMWLAGLDCDFRVDLGPERLSVCDGEEVTLSNQDGTVLPRTSYLWSDGSVQPAITVAGAVDTTYGVVAVSPDACESSDTIRLQYTPMPGLLALEVEDINCGEQNSGSITVVVDGATQSYTLAGRTFSDGGTTVTDLEPGEYAIRLVGQNPACLLDSTAVVADQGALILELPELVEAVYGDSVQLTTGLDSEGARFTWAGPGLSCTTCATPYVTVLQDAEIVVEVVNEAGCKAEARLQVRGRRDLSVGIPNIFSPNADGINDFFSLYPTAFVTSLGPLRIFDRWGNQVFVGSDEQITNGEGWDGDFRQRPAAAGGYSFVCAVEYRDGTTALLEGDLILIR